MNGAVSTVKTSREQHEAPSIAERLVPLHNVLGVVDRLPEGSGYTGADAVRRSDAGGRRGESDLTLLAPSWAFTLASTLVRTNPNRALGEVRPGGSGVRRSDMVVR